MFKYATEKRRKYYDKVIEIYRETGYCAKKIEKLGIVPVSNHAIQDWINNFEAENGRIKPRKNQEKTDKTIVYKKENSTPIFG